ncbi:uncharacterized protein LOC130641941 [Hydractinia symbiolongicarpus]|uniref:uncharacterized protein LOC130641941 n=1 Tax=Hydractinia symbiolongicarpus TaxID=13093 RepID=UPI0025510AFA|nr:uncharacterized protein LOC130641941 [Hydractinia symbiolongicarpus]
MICVAVLAANKSNLIESLFFKWRERCFWLLDVFERFTLENDSIKPKAHFITHYPMDIRVFGPLAKTLRFELKNGYLKSCVAASRNTVKLCKSMAVQPPNANHQMLT